jgi:DUF1009 family protein
MAGRFRRLGLIAGGGDLPLRVVEACRRRGQDVFISGIEGAMDECLRTLPHEVVSIGEIGRRFAGLRREGCDVVTMAGTVGRPDFARLRLDFKATLLMPKVLAAARSGDDALLRVMVEACEREGFVVLGADAWADDLLGPAGQMSRVTPDETGRLDLEKARRIATLMGREDIGQGAVVCRGLVLAVEAAEGTAAMLDRVAQLAPALRGSPDVRAGVLFKGPKPQQEHRVDLPTIGVATVEQADRAGLAGIGFAAGATLVIDRDAVVERADAVGLFLIGVAPDADP